MKIVRGSARIVLLFENFVLKFASITPLWGIVKETPVLVFRGRWKFIPNMTSRKWYWFMKGIRQNITERRCWKSCHESFLVPTYFSLGFISIQKREKGEEPTWEEMNKLVNKMGSVTKNQVYTIDPHCFSPKNFLRNNSGYRVFDYGDASYQPLRFTEYILRWRKELSEVFRAG